MRICWAVVMSNVTCECAMSHMNEFQVYVCVFDLTFPTTTDNVFWAVGCFGTLFQ